MVVFFPEFAETVMNGSSATLHERKLKDAGYKRHQAIGYVAIFSAGENNAFIGHGFKAALDGVLVKVNQLRNGSNLFWLEAHMNGNVCFLGCEKDAQYLID